jgi:glycosyltransferase involved in cell wall biosynthesis
LKVADVAVNTLEPTLVANVAFPNKVLQYMAAGLPVVSTKLAGLYSVFESEVSIGWQADAVSVVRNACQSTDEELSGLYPRQATKLALDRFSPMEAVAKFESDVVLMAKGFRP